MSNKEYKYLTYSTKAIHHQIILAKVLSGLLNCWRSSFTVGTSLLTCLTIIGYSMVNCGATLCTLWAFDMCIEESKFSLVKISWIGLCNTPLACLNFDHSALNLVALSSILSEPQNLHFIFFLFVLHSTVLSLQPSWFFHSPSSTVRGIPDVGLKGHDLWIYVSRAHVNLRRISFKGYPKCVLFYPGHSCVLQV